MSDGTVRRSHVFRVLDELSERIRKDNDGKHNVSPGGDVHKAYIEWRQANPDAEDEFKRSYRVVRNWDEASRPKIDKSNGQGILAFYHPEAVVPVDQDGGRKPLGKLTVADLDAWWEVQVAEHEAQKQAFSLKGQFHTAFRNELKGPEDTVHRVACEVFGWTPGVDSGETAE